MLRNIRNLFVAACTYARVRAFVCAFVRVRVRVWTRLCLRVHLCVGGCVLGVVSVHARAQPCVRRRVCQCV